jgi:predicted phosphodiesterase
MEIDIIGSVTGQPRYDARQIANIMETNQTGLSYGTEFMGRPGTKLYSSANDIVKLRSELHMNYERSRDWVCHTLEVEKKLAVHHPQKTWFLFQASADTCAVGNICPRIQPLHKLLEGTNALSKMDKLSFLEHVYRLYFQKVAIAGYRLDEGLSNFGVSTDNSLYYLDDDIYSWDDYVSFTHLLGVLIRKYVWFDAECAEQLGVCLRHLIAEFAKDSHASTTVAGKLRDIFIPDNKRRTVMDLMIETLENHKTIRVKRSFNDRYLAIFGDAHANLPALDAVLSFLREENITQGIVVGDTVGYGPHPAECIERLQETGFTVLKGNHDHAAASGETARGMSSVARQCIEWTIPLLAEHHKQWLNDLPMELHGMSASTKNWLAVHGAPSDPSYFFAYVYTMTYEQNLDNLAQRNIDYCFHGHSHVQGIYGRKKTTAQDKFYADTKISLNLYKHSLICPGSVGQPRDGGKGAQLAIFDQQTDEISFIAVPYDMATVLSDIRSMGLPDSLAVRLEKGQ